MAEQHPTVPDPPFYSPPAALEIADAQQGDEKFDMGTINWLCDELVAEVQQHRPKTTSGSHHHANQNSTNETTTPPPESVDPQALQTAAEQMFFPGRVFCNIFQLMQVAKLFGTHWNFAVKNVCNFSVSCTFGGPERASRKNPDPHKQRETKPPLAAHKCPFIIRASAFQTKRTRLKDVPRHRVMVAILKSSVYQHTCALNETVLPLCKKVSGEFFREFITVDVLKIVRTELEKANGQRVSSNMIREIIKPYIPDEYHLSSLDIFNIKKRALALGEPLQSEPARQQQGPIRGSNQNSNNRTTENASHRPSKRRRVVRDSDLKKVADEIVQMGANYNNEQKGVLYDALCNLRDTFHNLTK